MARHSVDNNKVPCVVFNNGVKCPILGLGTYKGGTDSITEAIKDAIDCGYRHFDCAHLYQNEKEIGIGLRKKIEDGTVKRSDLFITSKLWNTFHRPEMVEPALRTTLKNLGLDYLDLYLVHWPMAYKVGEDFFPKDSNGEGMHEDIPIIDTWKAMESMVKAGLAKSIGVSNFNSKQIESLLKMATIKPVTNQVECHVYLSQVKLQKFCEEKDIFLTAYRPLGFPNNSDDPTPVKDPVVVAIASNHNKSPSQILIKYLVQRGFLAVPKSTNRDRMRSNIDVFDFTLSKQEMDQLLALNKNCRIISLPWNMKHKEYPFSIEF